MINGRSGCSASYFLASSLPSLLALYYALSLWASSSLGRYSTSHLKNNASCLLLNAARVMSHYSIFSIINCLAEFFFITYVSWNSASILLTSKANSAFYSSYFSIKLITCRLVKLMSKFLIKLIAISGVSPGMSWVLFSKCIWSGSFSFISAATFTSSGIFSVRNRLFSF